VTEIRNLTTIEISHGCEFSPQGSKNGLSFGFAADFARATAGNLKMRGPSGADHFRRFWRMRGISGAIPGMPFVRSCCWRHWDVAS